MGPDPTRRILKVELQKRVLCMGRNQAQEKAYS